MATLTVEVTQEDIDAGKHGMRHLCPIALAVKRATATDVAVECGKVFPRFSPLPWAAPLAQLPIEAHRWYSAFDDFQDVSPFAFIVDWPARSPSPSPTDR